MTAGVTPAGEAEVRVGRYAQRDFDIAGAGDWGEPLELSLAAPFGALLSALFPARSFRVRSLALTYVFPDQLGRTATFSAKLRELRAGGEAQLSLIVFQGSRVCVRGEAIVVLDSPISSRPADQGPTLTNGKTSSGQANGERRQ